MLLGEKIKKLRTDNGLTQDELAEKIFVTRTAVSKWETGKGMPGIESLKELSRLFGVSLDELISDDDIENKKLSEDKTARRFYYISLAFFAAAAVLLMLSTVLKAELPSILAMVFVIGYVVCAIFAKPKYKREAQKGDLAAFLVPKILLFVIFVIVLVSSLK